MKTLIFLCVFICLMNILNAFVSPYKRSAREEDEERIIVKELASMIRNSRERLESQEDEEDYDGHQLLAVKKDDDIGASEKLYDDNSRSDDTKNKIKKEPFAVPPTDYRYYQKDFALESETLKPAPSSDQTSIVMPNVAMNSPNKKPLNETEEEIQRRKLYAHLTLNPSFIPYGQVQSIRIPPAGYYDDKNAAHFLALTYGTVCAILVITSGAAYVFCRKLRKNVKDAEEVDYPAYGVTGPNKDAPAPTGDRHLARSAQMYHYQHQKQQIVAMEKNSSPAKIRKGTESGSEEDDLTVYECPGLAPVTGEMEVKNPMFQDDEEVRISNASKESPSQKQEKPQEKKSSIQ